MENTIRRGNPPCRTATEAGRPARMAGLLIEEVGVYWMERSWREGLGPLVPRKPGRREALRAAEALYETIRRDRTEAVDARERLRWAQAARGLAATLLAEQ